MLRLQFSFPLKLQTIINNRLKKWRFAKRTFLIQKRTFWSTAFWFDFTIKIVSLEFAALNLQLCIFTFLNCLHTDTHRQMKLLCCAINKFREPFFNVLLQLKILFHALLTRQELKYSRRNFSPQVKEARDQLQSFNRKLISHNAMHRQSLHLIQIE